MITKPQSISAWLLLITAAFALTIPDTKLLYFMWTLTLIIWLIYNRQNLVLAPILITLAVPAVAFLLPSFLPSAWPPLLRLGLLTLLWSLVLGLLLRFYSSRQTAIN